MTVRNTLKPLALIFRQRLCDWHAKDSMVLTPQANIPAITDRALAAFLDQLHRLVLDETITAKRELLELWNQPLATRVAQGRAIEGLRVAKVERNGLIELACDRNTSRFREGDILCLNQGSPYFQPRFTVTLEEDDDTRLVVSTFDLMFNWAEVFRQDTGWILDEDQIDLSQFYLDALKHAGDSLIGRERILPLLMGRAQTTIDMARYDRGLALAEDFGLNGGQCEAFASAYAANLTYLIQGPPGTGKTIVLARLAQVLAEEGERVFVASFTHRAINNALNKLAEAAPDVPAIKIGEPTRADGLLVENYASFDDSPFKDLGRGYVIGATPFAARSSRLGGVEFETVIFDEASQVTLPLAIMGMLSAKRYIFIGDQQQLPPVLRTKHHTEALATSVFGRLVDRGFDTMLTDTYRLSTELAEWPSRRFYQGELKPVPEARQRRLHYDAAPERLARILDPERPKVFVDLQHRNTTTRSHGEASLVVDLILQAVMCGVPPSEMGVVTPYRAQAREIRNLLCAMLPDPEMRRAIIVDTVERMQGQERDLILFSLATSSPAFATQLAEFFFQPERLNVAITRARKKLIIVGSSHVLNVTPFEPEIAEAVDLLRDLLSTCVTLTPDYVT
jgi:DNA replication ATP-dependent helicase Dna2